MFTIKVSNFPGRSAGETVPWVTVDTGECKGAKRGREGAGINPHLILAVLGDDVASDSPHQKHLRTTCLKAIAMTQPTPISPVAKKAVAESTVGLFYGWDGKNVLPLMSRDEAVELAASNEDALFSTPANKEVWKTASELGLVVELPTPPTPTPQTLPVKPAVTQDDASDILDKINAARGTRVLSK